MANEKITFKYIFDDDYEPEYVNGVIGGIAPNGEIIMNFYSERLSLPLEAIQEVASDGRLLNDFVEVKPEELKYRRTIKTGISMNAAAAISMFQWLKEQLLEIGVEEDDL